MIGLGTVLVAVVTIQVSGQPAPRPPRGFEVSVLQALPDSLQVEVGPWGHSTPRAAVRGYVVRALALTWTRTDTVPPLQNVDTLWLPRDTVAMPIQVCVNALTEGQPSGNTCKPFTVPASTMVTAPGDFSVRIVSGIDIGLVVDSIGLFAGAEYVGRVPQIADSTYKAAWVAFTDDPGRTIMIACARAGAEVGWYEVEPTEDGSWIRPRQPGVYLSDPACGWQLDNQTPGIATIEPPTEPYNLSAATKTLDVQLTQFPSGLWGLSARLTTSGAPVAGALITVELLVGNWKDGSAVAKTVVTNAEGLITPGDLSANARVRVTADDALPVERAVAALIPSAPL